ncbi:cysteine--tRNA ligase [Rhodospirillum rubrum]|uniref:Cysteine--tRNA ligase n=1 Tax=Rhodospirillum rubrum (strain ATCC 11170 / ATH 1.1.1 / DSM 467 / LMG 4362 / NCIMB 8255 / S1) TaxID=269796 RepID=SYC_RHORT|nr:cysteine--tRNA ligase [Rhodospirillum rubrum]Q2RWK2.1 RecName: Full=Cysteine--tRNA ligase; AltName: Full=Cysteinyl-tRNA synthetase; Short=CysRS [Rhodospirillum rubrum ATCC 11170]ABC21493.1 cysteinyl-tRNA synthetase [Rhodospirillum rubrum ATCC 11170]AEO47176.1 cysteinyl-tRNA synthetase [Rhodospirillum rubrum F11]MBK5953089.1 cysteine--tRNA ligase [Rhodospirillum rubrum]QXG81167.1 cysteine--tRNA ligase [Rhodospirillum rubrum]HAQ01413.1 cysteine--tRNA ligase [Rhodospirillum rubrum]
MTLHIHNTMTRTKEVFEPLDPGHVRLYVCGPTVYDRAHIGNARPVIVFDLLARLLRRLYPQVTYVRNITDVDDKINARASASGRTIGEITEETTRLFHEDMAELGALPPDVEPRATAHIADMVAMIERLIAKGHAYEAEGHVLFSVPSMGAYGSLSGRSMDDMIAGARVEVAPYKRDPADFVLWKPSDASLPGWDSPWGRGRPGWHIECSAMSSRYLGPSFDIHGGGLDLIFPHHENEIAQSVCCNGPGTFARYWMHNGYLMVEGEKMSKSLGNFVTVRDLLDQAPGEAMRLAMLGTHYRQPFDWTAEGLEQARRGLDRLYSALRRVAGIAASPAEVPEGVMAALCDDLNTPKALAEVYDLLGVLNRATTTEEQAKAKGALLAAGALLGLFQADPEVWLCGAGTGEEEGLAARVEDLICQRKAARQARDFARADAIRDELTQAGIVLEDGPNGTTWRKA